LAPTAQKTSPRTGARAGVQWHLVLSPLLWILRVCAYIFHFILSLFLIGMGVVALLSHEDLNLAMLPWKGPAVTRAALLLGALGVICVALAVTGIARWFFPLWALFAFVMIFRGYFASPYTFATHAEFQLALWLAVISFGAFLVSLSLFGRRRRRV